MKSLSVIVMYLLTNRGHRARLGTLGKFLFLLSLVIIFFTIAFHVMMLYEGRSYSAVSGLYWVFTTMSTLGFGDITFNSDLGRLFSIVVMLAGIFLLLVMLPFTFIESLYAPWMQAQTAGRAPRTIPATVHGHILFTHHDPIFTTLQPSLERIGIRSAVLVADLQEALALHDAGVPVVVGSADDPDTWKRAGVERAALVAVNGTDMANANAILTAREVAATPVVTLARSNAAEEILRLAGATQVVRLGQGLGAAMARRIPGGGPQIIGQIDDQTLAEVPAGPALAGRSLIQSRIRETHGVTVVGRWDRGRLRQIKADEVHDATSQVVIAGPAARIAAWPEVPSHTLCRVIVIGGGRVGRSAASILRERGHHVTVIDTLAERVAQNSTAILGDGSDHATLTAAGILDCGAVLITTHDDDTNIFIGVLVRRLNPTTIMVARATHERNVSTLHRAGADTVLSYAGLGAAMIFDLLHRPDALLVADGLVVWQEPIPEALAQRSLADSGIASLGCQVLSLRTASGAAHPFDEPLPRGGSACMIGDGASYAAWSEKLTSLSRDAQQQKLGPAKLPK